ncbi:uncharacterized protein LOC131044171 [Cryptomeria japonica]|uniref:uncharacterized protein LOC131044171 n=1 Tax=Cryptomeria japonica TaxID=3369 RepID=UPI0027DA9C50|nr:uncharacterized protein LOC131044171 [Cryptomeria japonica]XP_057833428.2 uncharacterized protein LOC131044171 [Cryptomeria japonica]
MAAPGGGMGLLAVIMVSGGVALLLLRRHKLVELTFNKSIQSNSSSAFSCLFSGEDLPKKKKKKKVHFAAELVECFGEKQEHHREETERCQQQSRRADSAIDRHPVEEKQSEHNIPANRLALYNGMLRYRMNQASLYR